MGPSSPLNRPTSPVPQQRALQNPRLARQRRDLSEAAIYRATCLSRNRDTQVAEAWA